MCGSKGGLLLTPSPLENKKKTPRAPPKPLTSRYSFQPPPGKVSESAHDLIGCYFALMALITSSKD